MATDITVSFQAIKDTELGTNALVDNKGMITYSDTKIRLGTGTGNIDYLQLLKDDIINNLPSADGSIVYHGQKTTTEIDDATTGYPTMANGLVYDTTEGYLYYIKKEQTATDYKLKIPIGTYMYAERYIAGENIRFDDNADGTKTINAVLTGFSGYAIYNSMPSAAELADTANQNKVFFVL